MTADTGFDLPTVDRLLSTTRAVRRRLDLERPVPLSVIEECLSLAVQAPSGSNLETWRWLVITDTGIKERLAELYRVGGPTTDLSSRLSEQARTRMGASADHLREHLHRVPVLVVPCVEAVGGAAGWAPSIYPAVWSFMLALRSRGLGSVLTTVHLYHRAEADRLLGVPAEYVQACLLPVAYTLGGDFKRAPRKPVGEVTFLDHWGQPLR